MSSGLDFVQERRQGRAELGDVSLEQAGQRLDGHPGLDPLHAAEIARDEGDDGVVGGEQIARGLGGASDDERGVLRLEPREQAAEGAGGLESPVGRRPLGLPQLEELAAPAVVRAERRAAS